MVKSPPLKNFAHDWHLNTDHLPQIYFSVEYYCVGCKKYIKEKDVRVVNKHYSICKNCYKAVVELCGEVEYPDYDKCIPIGSGAVLI